MQRKNSFKLSLLSLTLSLSSWSACLGPGTLNKEKEKCFSDGREVIQQSCVKCHSINLTGSARNGASEGVDFDSEEDIQLHRDAIRQMALVEESMPPGAPLATCNKDTLEIYLDQLAP